MADVTSTVKANEQMNSLRSLNYEAKLFLTLEYLTDYTIKF